MATANIALDTARAKDQLADPENVVVRFNDAEREQYAATMRGLQGYWLRDPVASSGMEEVVEVLGLPSLLAKAVSLIKAIDIDFTTSDTMLLSICSAISWFKLSEVYDITGGLSKNSRRDMRFGGMTTRLTGQAPNKLMFHMKWGTPYEGGAHESIELLEGGQVLMFSSDVYSTDKAGVQRRGRYFYKCDRAPRP